VSAAIALVDRGTLEVIDVALQTIGGLGCVAFVVHLFRSGRYRNPLAGLGPPTGGPGVLELLLVLLIGFSLTNLLVRAAGLQPAAAWPTGSHAWHVAATLASAVQLLLAGLMVAFLRRRPSFPPMQSSASLRLKQAGAGVLVTLLALPIAALQVKLCAFIWRAVWPDAAPPVHDVLQAIEGSGWGVWGRVQLTLSAVVAAALYEELLFRGLLLQLLWRHLRNPWLAILLSAVVFGLIHRQPQNVLPLATLGIFLGYARLRYRSLWVCIMAHAVFNARTMALALLNPELIRAM